MENALLVSINHWNQLNDLQLTFLFDSWYYTYNYNVQNIICVLLSFLWFIFSNITLFSIHEFWWLIAKNRHFFTDFFLIQKQSYHFTEIKIHLFRFSRGVYTSLFMKHKRMLFLVRFHRKSNQLSPSAFSAKKYGWTEKQSAGHSTKTGAKCWWSDWKVFSAVNNTVDWFM